MGGTVLKAIAILFISFLVFSIASCSTSKNKQNIFCSKEIKEEDINYHRTLHNQDIIEAHLENIDNVNFSCSKKKKLAK